MIAELIFKQSFLSLFFRSASVVSNFLLVGFVFPQVTPQDFAFWSLLFSIVMWFPLFDLGIGAWLRQHMGSSGTKLVGKHLSYLIFIYSTVSLLLTLGAFVYLYFYTNLFNISTLDYAVYMLSYTSFFMMYPVFSMFYVFHKSHWVFGAQALVPLVTLALVGIYVIFGSINLSLLLHFQSAAFLLSTASIIYLYSSKINGFFPCFSLNGIRRLKKYFFVVASRGKAFFLLQIFVFALFQADRIYISLSYDLDDLILYDFMLRYLSLYLFASMAFTGTLWAIFSSHKSVIEDKFKYLLFTFLVVSFVILLFLFFMTDFFFSYWLPPSAIELSQEVKLYFCLYVFAYSFFLFCSNIENGKGNVEWQIKCLFFIILFFSFILFSVSPFLNFINFILLKVLVLSVFSLISSYRSLCVQS